MWCKKCDSSSCSVMKLCPFSFGLSVAVVSFFAVLLWSLWVLTYGMSPEMVAMNMPTPTMGMAFVHALLGLVKGFIFGFFVALFYDCFACCFAHKKSGSMESDKL